MRNTCNMCLTQLQNVLETYKTFTMNKYIIDVYTCDLMGWYDDSPSPMWCRTALPPWWDPTAQRSEVTKHGSPLQSGCTGVRSSLMTRTRQRRGGRRDDVTLEGPLLSSQRGTRIFVSFPHGAMSGECSV